MLTRSQRHESSSASDGREVPVRIARDRAALGDFRIYAAPLRGASFLTREYRINRCHSPFAVKRHHLKVVKLFARVGPTFGSGPNFVILPAPPAQAAALRGDALLISVVVALQGEVSGLLVVQRLSKPAVLPGVRGVIVARRRVLVMPGFG